MIKPFKFLIYILPWLLICANILHLLIQNNKLRNRLAVIEKKLNRPIS